MDVGVYRLKFNTYSWLYYEIQLHSLLARTSQCFSIIDLHIDIKTGLSSKFSACTSVKFDTISLQCGANL